MKTFSAVSLKWKCCQTQDIHTCYMKGLFWQCLGNTDNHSTSRRAPCCELFRRGGMTFSLPCRPLRVSHGMKLSSSIYRYEISHADYLIKHLVTLAFSSMGDLLTNMVCFLINLSLSLSLSGQLHGQSVPGRRWKAPCTAVRHHLSPEQKAANDFDLAGAGSLRVSWEHGGTGMGRRLLQGG